LPGLPGGIVQGLESAAGDADKNKPLQTEMAHERGKVLTDTSRLRACLRNRDATATSSAIERDDPEPSGNQVIELWFPAFTGTGIRMKKDNRGAIPAAVAIKKTDTGQVRELRVQQTNNS